MKLVSFDVGIRNLCVCVLEQTTGTLNSEDSIRVCPLHWEVLDLLADNNVRRKHYTIADATTWLVKSMEKRRALVAGVDVAVIEQQPTGRQSNNIKMKVLSHVLQACIHSTCPTAKVQFFNPKVKFRAITQRNNDVDGGAAGTTASRRYGQRKKMGIAEAQRCLPLCDVADNVTHWFGALKKKDARRT